MEIKIVDSEELGSPQPETLTLFGNEVGRKWTKVTFTAEQEATVRGNRFFAVKGSAETAATDEAGYDTMTVPKLKALAAERSVDLGDAVKNGDIIAALQLADEAAAQDAEDEA